MGRHPNRTETDQGVEDLLFVRGLFFAAAFEQRILVAVTAGVRRIGIGDDHVVRGHTGIGPAHKLLDHLDPRRGQGIGPFGRHDHAGGLRPRPRQPGSLAAIVLDARPADIGKGRTDFASQILSLRMQLTGEPLVTRLPGTGFIDRFLDGGTQRQRQVCRLAHRRQVLAASPAGDTDPAAFADPVPQAGLAKRELDHVDFRFAQRTSAEQVLELVRRCAVGQRAQADSDQDDQHRRRPARGRRHGDDRLAQRTTSLLQEIHEVENSGIGRLDLNLLDFAVGFDQLISHLKHRTEGDVGLLHRR